MNKSSIGFTRVEKESLAIENAVLAFNSANNNPNSNLAPIYAALTKANHFGVFGLVAVRKHFNLNPDWTLPICKSMGGIYSKY